MAALLLGACASEETGTDRSPEREPGLAGLYSASVGEGEDAAVRGDRLCFSGAASEPEGASFAFVTLGGTLERGRAACSGLGRARREENALTLTLAGEGDCSFTARIADERIRFPSKVPEGCSYYCSEAASLAGQEFALIEAGEEAARRALDLVGDPLCP